MKARKSWDKLYCLKFVIIVQNKQAKQSQVNIDF